MNIISHYTTDAYAYTDYNYYNYVYTKDYYNHENDNQWSFFTGQARYREYPR